MPSSRTDNVFSDDFGKLKHSTFLLVLIALGDKLIPLL